MTDHDTPGSTRLDKHLAALIGCSRGDAQLYIEGGWVRVDGEVVEEPQAPIGMQRVELDPDARLEPAEPATILLNKPAGVRAEEAVALLTAETRWEGDGSGLRPLQRHLHGLAPVMPLEDEASGLLVLTQDWRVRRRLTDDRASLEQEYVVEIHGDLAPYGMRLLAGGLVYDGRTLGPCKVSWQNENRLRFAIKDVQPGQLRYMCAQAGFDVVAIRRLRIGRVALSKMPEGRWRYLPVGERF
jgi:23S rRNA pseudouridine2604 synthase